MSAKLSGSPLIKINAISPAGHLNCGILVLKNTTCASAARAIACQFGTAVATRRAFHNPESPMLRAEVTQKILFRKRLKRLSWKTIVAEIGGGAPVYITAALMGQMKLRPDQADRAALLLELSEEEKL